MEILYQDDRVIVCVKPAGVLSTDEPGGMPSLLRGALGDENANIRGVHRLDQGVGGVMVYARTKRAAQDLSEQMRKHEFEKKYLAVTLGAPMAERGELTNWLKRDTLAHKTFAVPEGAPDARLARLSYEVTSTKGALSLVSITLHTGRTHQIRCQFAEIGLPLWGDRKYGASEGEAISLWSNAISFHHPRTGERLVFAAPPPNVHPWTIFI